DPTNADTSFLRNAIRLEGIPALERATRRDVRGPIARSARLLRQDLDRFGPAASPDLPQHAWQRVDDGYLLYLHRIPDQAFHWRLTASALRELDAPVPEAAIAAVVGLEQGRPGRRRHLGGGLLAVREREYIRIARTSPVAREGRRPSR